jgi:hypothetical protein
MCTLGLGRAQQETPFVTSLLLKIYDVIFGCRHAKLSRVFTIERWNGRWREEHMKTLLFFIPLAAVMLWAENTTAVTVKSSQVTTGVVLVTVSENGKTFDLQCNDGHPFCNAVKPGEYQMVRLPKNRGMYDCQNVDLYVQAADTENDEKLGEYCLNQ